MSYLQFYLDGRARTREIHSDVTIGRTEISDLVVNDPLVSRLHCRVVRTDEGWVLTDVKSRTGTWLGEQRITRQPLRDGDEFRIGRTRIVFREQLWPQAGEATAGLSEDELLHILGENPSSGLAHAVEQASEPVEAPPDAEATSSSSRSLPSPATARSTRRSGSSLAALIAEAEGDLTKRSIEKASRRSWRQVTIPRGLGFVVIGVATIFLACLTAWMEF